MNCRTPSLAMPCRTTQLGGSEPRLADGLFHRVRRAGREVPGTVQQVPGAMPAVALAPLPAGLM
jgi:hypothetical protein